VLDEAGRVANFVWVVNDVTEREQHEELLEYQANHDALTGLPNRNLLADRITQSLANAHRYNLTVAVLFVDLDNFKFVNDSLGHALGDRMLIIQADRLNKSIRSGDTVARYGGDEFVIVVSNLEKPEDAATVAHNIQELVSRPFSIDGHEFGITCSIGISLYPKDGLDVDTLLKNADAAMYRAKEQSRNSFQFYTSEINDRVVERMVIERHLRHALEMGELEMHFQPQVELGSGRIVGVEALLRWHSPDLGTVPPDRFIPLAEETGLIVPIGDWVLKTCCQQNKAWQAAGLTPLTISVNISARQLQKKDLSAVIAGILQESGLEPRFLELEIVESMVMKDVESSMAIMKELKGLGIQLAMDDFGTGYSSLSYLKRFPFDKLKIDLSFVRDIMTDPESAAIARAIIAMAHNLNLRAIAEGVETEEQLKYLRLHGCDEIQGYYVSQPVNAREFEELLRKDNWLPPSAKRGATA
jgi:diguanylate cyclase (GGDEF)-like protein